jgi:hypothetical protein
MIYDMGVYDHFGVHLGVFNHASSFSEDDQFGILLGL